MAVDGDTLGAALALARANPASEQAITEAVEGWLDEHPEATTTVQDKSITKAKLDDNLQVKVDELDRVKSAISDLEEGSLSAVGATAGQVPVADGNGSWAWGNVSGGVNLASVQTYVADYTNEPPTPTSGSVDKYYRRIYGT